MNSNLFAPLVRLVRGQFLGLIALALVLTGGAAYAAAAKDSVTSRSIKNGAVKTIDIANDAVTSGKVAQGTLTGDDVADNGLTGDDVDEGTLGSVPNAAFATQAGNAASSNNSAGLGGLSPSSYAHSTVYKIEAPTDAGTTIGDGTSTKSMACNTGDILLSGGPASLSATTDLIESFPTPGLTNSWTSRIDKNSQTDSWTVVVLCLDQ